MTNYDLYHLEYDNDKHAQTAIDRLYPQVRAEGGVIWPSLNHGIGETSYLVVAFPSGVKSAVTRGLSVVETLSSEALIAHLEDRIANTLAEPGEGQDQEDEEGPDDEGGPNFDPYAGGVVFDDGGDDDQ